MKKGYCLSHNIKEVAGENNMITICKFKCIKGCGEEILFNDIKFHYNFDCLSNKKRSIKIFNGKRAADYAN